jgi:hypothetical protein
MACDCATDIYTIFKDTIVVASAIGAVCVAASGLKTWKAQLKGTVEYDLTRRLLRATYKLRDAFAVVRNPIMWANEFVPPPPDFKGDAEEERFYGMAAAYEKRWDHVVKARRELDAELLEAEVIWDSGVNERFHRVLQLQQELLVNLNAHLRSQNPRNSPATRQSTHEAFRNRREVLYADGSPEDEFAKDLALALKAVEDHLKPHLKK